MDIESTTYHEYAGGGVSGGVSGGRGVGGGADAGGASRTAGTPGAEGGGERFNVYAAMPGVTPEVVLSTHMDTVPPFFGLHGG